MESGVVLSQRTVSAQRSISTEKMNVESKYVDAYAYLQFLLRRFIARSELRAAHACQSTNLEYPTIELRAQLMTQSSITSTSDT